MVDCKVITGLIEIVQRRGPEPAAAAARLLQALAECKLWGLGSRAQGLCCGPPVVSLHPWPATPALCGLVQWECSRSSADTGSGIPLIGAQSKGVLRGAAPSNVPTLHGLTGAASGLHSPHTIVLLDLLKHQPCSPVSSLSNGACPSASYPLNPGPQS